jgi:pyruvate dehydrogenase E2 component (dihydrolipoamide acetyltransferase)
MPKLSDTMTVGTLVKWLKQEGDAVTSGDMLAEVETDKATMELESVLRRHPAQGLLSRRLPGGDRLGALRDRKTRREIDAPAATPKPAAAAPAMPPSTTAVPAAVFTPPAPAPAPVTVAIAAPPRAAGERVKISPLAKKLAAEKGLDASRLVGSGPGGRIVRADVVAGEKPAATSGSSRFTGGTAGRAGPIQEERTVPVSNMRGAIARRLLESKTQLPHFYVEIEIDAARF